MNRPKPQRAASRRIEVNDPARIEFERSRRIASDSDSNTKSKGGVDKLYSLMAKHGASSGLFSGVTEAATQAPTHQIKQAAAEDQSPRNMVSRNQWNAITKYPELIEMLGKEGIGEKIASSIMGDVRSILIQQIENNTQTYNKYAKVCVLEKQNMKQYFQGDDWVCCVMVNGPFRGDEIIHYKREADKSLILRKVGEKDFEDVTEQFNVIHTVVDDIESESDIPQLAEEE